MRKPKARRPLTERQALLVKSLIDAGYQRNYTVVAPSRKRYRIAFAAPRLRRAVELGKETPQSVVRDSALRRLGWRVYRL